MNQNRIAWFESDANRPRGERAHQEQGATKNQRATPWRHDVLRVFKVACVVFVTQFTLEAQEPALPPENALPGIFTVPSEASGEVPKSMERHRLPGEATLPGVILGEAGETIQGFGSARALPREDQLPSETEMESKTDFVQDIDPNAGRLEDAAPGDQRPILQLNYAGHSSPIRSLALSQDGKHLASVGDDKTLQLWMRRPGEPQKWLHRRTARWQVWRGPRGTLSSVRFHENQVAIAGYGAMGGTGEIWLADSDSGDRIATLFQYDSAHRQVVSDLRFAPDGSRLASSDTDGAIVLWARNRANGLWQPSPVQSSDREALGQSRADALQLFRGFHPLAWCRDRLVTLHHVRMQSGAVPFPIWNLRLNSPTETLPGEIAAMVSDLTAAPDGRTIAAACHSMRVIRVWKQSRNGNWTYQDVPTEGKPLFVRFDPSRQRFLAGMEPDADATPSVLLVDVSSDAPAIVSRIVTPAIASDGVFDPVTASVILAVGSSLQVHPLASDFTLVADAIQTLRAPLQPIVRVAGSKSSTGYRVAISRDAGTTTLTDSFDASETRLDAEAINRPDDYLPSQRLARRYTLRPSANDRLRYDMYRDEDRIGSLPLDPAYDGVPTTLSTLPSAGIPLAKERTDDAVDLVVIAANKQNNVYLFAIPSELQALEDAQAKRELSILRQYRGHQATVRTTSSSVDARYLYSGGDDALVMIWNAAGCVTASRSMNRWGANFESVDDEDADGDANDMLIVGDIDPAGPLYFRGVRAGDRLQSVSWAPSANEIVEKTVAKQMIDALEGVPMHTQVFFRFERQGAPIAPFQMIPAWYPLASLMIDREREWAFWTPSGLYDASLNGHRRFGWQVNNGLEQDVDFYTADHFRQALEKPAVMRDLLRRGNLRDAMRERLSGRDAPPGQSAVSAQIQSLPKIRIESPSPGVKISGDSLTLIVNIEPPNGTKLKSVSAYLDGIPARRVKTLHDAAHERYQWQFDLPRSWNMQAEVIALSDTGAFTRETLSIERVSLPDLRPRGRRPAMHVIAMGISDYQDRNIVSPDFSARSVTHFCDLLRERASGLYRVSTDQLLDDQATRPLWRIYTQELRDRLASSVGPDDLVVMFLVGHGLRDRLTGRWYFVPADARLRDLMNDQYQDCLAMDDLAVFGDLPCRKILILDACHSGAIQADLRGDDLRAIVRVLEQDRVLTLSASEGQEEAAEVAEAGLGRFTNRLLKALSGEADLDGDRQVSLAETVRYVRETVVAESTAEGLAQHPTASPIELINRLAIPLTQTAVMEPALETLSSSTPRRIPSQPGSN
ncbi:MAG: caspase family protein [Planctomycetota bacterium]